MKVLECEEENYIFRIQSNNTYVNLYRKPDRTYMIAHHVWYPGDLMPITSWIESDDLEWIIRRYRQLIINLS